MRNIKMVRSGNGNTKNNYIGKIIIILIIAASLAVFLLKNPSITGKAVGGKETVFSENLRLQVNESGTYEWQVKNPGAIKSLKATGAVSSNGTARVYIENNGTRQLIFDSTKQLFDISIHVLPEYKTVSSGGEVLVQIALVNLRGFGGGNVSVHYAVKDAKGNLIASEQESVFVETQARFIRKLITPEEIKPASYVAFVEASTNGTNLGTGSDTFEVKPSAGKYSFNSKYYLIGFAALIVFIAIIAIGTQLYKIIKKKQEIVKLKEKVPLEKVKKLQNELKALEEAYKSGFLLESYHKEKKRIEKLIKAFKK